MSGLIPAIPLIVIRPFLPESPKWAQKKLAGTLRRPSIAELFSPELRSTTVLTTIMSSLWQLWSGVRCNSADARYRRRDRCGQSGNDRKGESRERGGLKRRRRQGSGSVKKARPPLREKPQAEFDRESRRNIQSHRNSAAWRVDSLLQHSWYFLRDGAHCYEQF